MLQVVVSFMISALLSALSSLLIVLFTKQFAPKWISKRYHLGRIKERILADTMQGLAVNQLVTAIGISIATTTEYGLSWEDPHAILAAALCVLASCSQACPIALLLSNGHMHRVTAYIHAVLSTVPGNVMVCFWYYADVELKGHMKWINFALVFSMIYQVVAAIAFVGMLFWADLIKKSSPINRFTALCIYVVALAILIIPLALVIWLKWRNNDCNMHRGPDASWNSFGQLLALVMISTVVISVLDGIISKSRRK